MQVKTFTYKKLLGTFRVDSWSSSANMDDHMAEMLTNGWTVTSQVPFAGNGKILGNIVPDKMVITYTKQD